jgi:hypothetical protein
MVNFRHMAFTNLYPTVGHGRFRVAAAQPRIASRTGRDSRVAPILSARGIDLRRHLPRALFAVALAGQFVASAAAGQKYQSGDWITECEAGAGTPECSIMIPFSKSENGERGAFALAVVLQTGDIGIVGQPSPLRAVLHIGNNPPIECREPHYCLFPRDQSLAAIGQLNAASVILVDVLTAKTSFKFSLTTRGYQAGLAQIRAWGYRLSAD